MSPMDLIIEEAISNSTILIHIFRFLNDEDLETCCHVSQCWRKVADPMVFSHFQIQLGKQESLNDDDFEYYEPERLESDCIVIRESARYNRKKFTTIDELGFSNVTKILEKALLTNKVSITLRIRAITDDQKKLMKMFLSKFGPLVVEILEFEYKGYFPVNKLCMILLHYLPNLRKLNFTGSIDFNKDSPRDRNFNPDLPRNQHKHLRKISFSTDTHLNVQCFVTILKMAPHLDDIQRLPLHLTIALEVTQKGQVLKTLNYDYKRYPVSGEKGVMFLTHFQTLARLQPKLSSFHLLENPLSVENDNLFDRIKPLIFSVLESSSETLQTLYIPCTGWRGFERLPRMEALLKLEFGEMDRKYEGLIFPANISLTESFPNVREIHLPVYKLGEILNRLPGKVMTPWGSRIKLLKVEFLSLKTFYMLQAHFPFIEDFQFLGSSNEIAEILPALALYWPNLKSLGIGMNPGWDRRPDNRRPCKLDCVFTGLSEEVLDQLRDSSRRGFTDEQIQRFKDESPMGKLKELRDFTLTFKQVHDVLRLSPLANEFGFKLLSNLEVTLEIRQRDELMRERIKEELEPLAHCDNIKIDEYYNDREYRRSAAINDPQHQLNRCQLYEFIP